MWKLTTVDQQISEINVIWKHSLVGKEYTAWIPTDCQDSYWQKNSSPGKKNQWFFRIGFELTMWV